MSEQASPNPVRPLRYDLLCAEGDFPIWNGTPHRSFLLCTTYRSGSNLFAEALLDQGGFGCPLEYYDQGMRSGLEARWGTKNPADYLAALYRYRTDPTGAFGIKLDWARLLLAAAEHNPKIAPLVQAGGFNSPEEERRMMEKLWNTFQQIFPNPQFICLTRQDKVRQAVSWVRAKQTHRFWGIPSAIRSEDSEAHYDYDQILRIITMFTYSEECMNRLFAWAGIEPVQVVYEKFVADYAGTVQRVAEALDGRTNITVRPPRLQRQSDTVSEEWVKRFLQEHHERTAE